MKHSENLSNSKKSERGNTKFSPPKQGKKHRNWMFTWNNYTEENIESIKSIKNCGYIFQPEIGEEGTPHLQGCLLFKSPRTFAQVKRLYPEIHLESIKYKKKAIEYCKKQETKAGPRVTNMLEHEEIYDMLSEVTPLPWQQQVINICKGPVDRRVIHWIWSEDGCLGKTELTIHLVLKYDAIIVGGSKRDAFYAVASAKGANLPTRVILFDIPREEMNKLSYAALEKIKDGIFFSSKYESRMCLINKPHVIVLANSPPKYHLLSKDRWNVTFLGEEPHPLATLQEDFGPSLLLRKNNMEEIDREDWRLRE